MRPTPVRIEAPPGHTSQVQANPNGSYTWTQKPPDRGSDGRHFTFEDLEAIENSIFQNLRDRVMVIKPLVQFMDECEPIWKGAMSGMMRDWRSTPDMNNVIVQTKKEASEEDKIIREVRGSVNKLTPERYVPLKEKVSAIVAQIVREQQERAQQNAGGPEAPSGEEGGVLGEIVKIVYEAAVTQKHLAGTYAELCKDIATHEAEQRQENLGKGRFRRMLVNHCQKEFETLKQDNTRRAHLKRSGVVMTPEQEVHDTKARKRAVGNIHFVGELFKRQLLTEKIMHSILKLMLIPSGGDKGETEERLQELPEEDQLDTMAELLTTIGKQLDKREAKSYMEFYMKFLTRLSNDARISNRVRFKLQDVVQLRERGWVPRRDAEGPKTIEEFNRSLQQKQLKKEQDIYAGRSWVANAQPAMQGANPGGMMQQQQAQDHGGYQAGRAPIPAQAQQPLPRQEGRMSPPAAARRAAAQESQEATQIAHERLRCVREEGVEALERQCIDDVKARRETAVWVECVLAPSLQFSKGKDREAAVRMLRHLNEACSDQSVGAAFSACGGISGVLGRAAYNIFAKDLVADAPKLLQAFVEMIHPLVGKGLTDFGASHVFGQALLGCLAFKELEGESEASYEPVGKLLVELYKLMKVHKVPVPGCRIAVTASLLGADEALEEASKEMRCDVSLLVCKGLKEPTKAFEQIKEDLKDVKDAVSLGALGGVLAHLWQNMGQTDVKPFLAKMPAPLLECIKKLWMFLDWGDQKTGAARELAFFLSFAGQAGEAVHKKAKVFCIEFLALLKKQQIPLKLPAPGSLEPDLQKALEQISAYFS